LPERDELQITNCKEISYKEMEYKIAVA